MTLIQEVFHPFYKAFLHRRRDGFFQRQQWPALAEVSRRLLSIDPHDYRALNDLAVALYSLQDYDGALDTCRQLFKTAPEVRADLQFAAEGPRYLRYLSIYAKALVRKNEFEKARRVLEPLKKMGVYFHDKYFLLSRVYKQQDKLALAAAQLEEMQRVYEPHTREWETLVREKSLAILERAAEVRDADAALFAIRAIVRSSIHSHSFEKTLEEASSSPARVMITAGLKVFHALLETQWETTLLFARDLGWPELASRFEILVLSGRGRFEEAFRLLNSLPTDSIFHLEQVRLLQSPAFSTDPEFLRDYAQCHLMAGCLEEAHRAMSTLNSACKPELADLDWLKDVRKLLLERAIWEDEKRLGQHRDPEAELTSRVLPSAPESVELTFRAKPLRVRLSESIRQVGEHGRLAEEDIRFRLAENYLRAGGRADAALRHLQDLSRTGSPLRLRALALAALQFIRSGQAEAGRVALQQFREAAPAPSRDELKPIFLELGEACEAAGLKEEAKELYGALLAADIDYSDVKERLAALKSGPQAQPNASVTRNVKLRKRFADLTEIGRGGMGVVYRAYDPLFERSVALKVLADRYQTDPDACRRFAREGQAMSQLTHHPGIVRIYEFGMQNEFYIAMELVTGESLRALLRRRGRLPSGEVRTLGTLVASALGFAHRSGIFHRDIKPDNVLLAEKGQPKIVDFGLADIAAATVITRTGTVMGTGPYMSPEQIRGRDFDARSDIYSLGAMLFEVSAGRPPFEKGDLAYQHLNEAPPAPRSLAPELPAALEATLLRCLEKTPEKRFQTCEDLERALAAI